jgi:hypothetical protein
MQRIDAVLQILTGARTTPRNNYMNHCAGHCARLNRPLPPRLHGALKGGLQQRQVSLTGLAPEVEASWLRCIVRLNHINPQPT